MSSRSPNSRAPVERMRRYVRAANRMLFKAANHGLDRAETRAARRSGRLDAEAPGGPLFIVGAPRCGSTLAYQLMTTYFDTAYLTNFHGMLHGSPAFAERIGHRLLRRAPSFESTYGRTKGWGAPAECGEFWYRFFRRRPVWVPEAEADPERMHALRYSVGAFASAAGRPLVFKNLFNTMRIEPLLHTFPNAAFLVVRRDLNENAASILLGRLRERGTLDTWWSVEPPDVDRLASLTPHAQAVEQIRSIHREIDRVRRDRPENFIDIAYEDLARDPRGRLDQVAASLRDIGIELESGSDVPTSFPIRSSGPALDADLLASVRKYIDTEPALPIQQ